MPPKKRKAPAASKKAPGGKRGKKLEEEEPAEEQQEEEEAGPSTARDAMAKLRADATKKKRKAKVDENAPAHIKSSAQVYEDYDCMLNQTNIGHNNNKFYIIQVLEQGGTFYAWNRWGRVGEIGQSALKGFAKVDAAIKEFEKKFQDKTRNKWADRENFSPKPKKYTMIEMDGDDDDGEDEQEENKDAVDGLEKKIVKKCSLDPATQSLVKLIFDNDMFRDAMASMDIDVKKMPLGKLSKTQIAKGFEVLEDIEDVLNKKKKGNLTELTSRFYTLIPHDFGRARPPVINDAEVVRKKMDMLLVLADIEMAQSMQEEDKKKAKQNDSREVAHQLDQQYKMLNCKLTTLKQKSEQYEVIEKYMNSTSGGRKLNLLDVWEVDRDTEGDRFSAHDAIHNRKLLWHGTNIAVVAAILKGGLRIMPHSGGRVGRGIYFASENMKSACYVRQANSGVGIMFLNEVALGKEKHITVDDSSLKEAPKGFDSIVARGRTEPDPKLDTTLSIGGREVTVPQGKPIAQSDCSYSSFWQSEYLVYKESQNRIRYMLKIKF